LKIKKEQIMPTIGQKDSYAEWNSARQTGLDEKHGGWIAPIFALADEHNADPEMRPYKKAISTEEREKLIVGAAAAVTGIYRYFEARRLGEREPFDNVTTFRRAVPKIGRNDPCPCGSGKKFKQCCGRTTLH
jgi:uncharacterized protein